VVLVGVTTVAGCVHGCNTDRATSKAYAERRQLYDPPVPLNTIIDGCMGLFIGGAIASCFAATQIVRQFRWHFRRPLSSFREDDE